MQKHATTVSEPTSDLQKIKEQLRTGIPNAVTMEKASMESVDDILKPSSDGNLTFRWASLQDIGYAGASTSIRIPDQALASGTGYRCEINKRPQPGPDCGRNPLAPSISVGMRTVDEQCHILERRLVWLRQLHYQGQAHT